MEVLIPAEISKRIKNIKSFLNSTEDPEINVSAYDTAWVAMVGDVNNRTCAPQFPSTLEWIANNQLSDGSWGDAKFFCAYDRLLSTLACIIALKSWNVHLEKYEKGMEYLRENLCKLQDEAADSMVCGFELTFPALLDKAKTLGIEFPEDSPGLKEIYASRNRKLTRIPKEILHKIPTTLLYSLEGLSDLDWEKLLKLQCSDGSFLLSSASTAFALMETKDQKCLNYLNNVVQKFKGGAPSFYHMDLFKNVFVVDRLQRLGISRYFHEELKACIDYVARYWKEDGIGWAKHCPVPDLDDTCMGFRLLRLYGHEVSSDVFKNFKEGDTFFTYFLESAEGVSGIFNLYRASQVLFPGEKILEKANKFCFNFLKERQETDTLADKWIRSKDLAGEVNYALDTPWYASLPRLETRFYLEHYGGGDDVWISKVLYRFPYLSNDEYLNLAKLDYNNCQAIHLMELKKFQKWHEECKLGDFGVSTKELLFGYFLAASNIFEPERLIERIAWAKTTALLKAIESVFDSNSSIEQKKEFVKEFQSSITSKGHINGRTSKVKTTQALVKIVLETLIEVSSATLKAYGKDINQSLCLAWEKWLLKWQENGEKQQGEGELLVKTINLAAGRMEFEMIKYEKLFQSIDRLCCQLTHHRNNKVHESKRKTIPEIELEMQKLVQIVFQGSSNEIEANIKQTFFAVARSIYYTAICDPGTINYHIAQVLYKRVR